MVVFTQEKGGPVAVNSRRVLDVLRDGSITVIRMNDSHELVVKESFKKVVKAIDKDRRRG